MKLAKLSLAAIMTVGALATSATAADNLADAFKNGKLNGELKAFYFDREGGGNAASSGTTGSNAEIFNVGVMLNYVTDPLMGLTMGLTFQSSHAPFADEDAKADFSGSTATGDMYGSGAQLSQAYINYAVAKTNIKIGRQFIASPLVNNSGSRMVKDAFEALTVVSNDVPNTTLMAGAITKWQARTDGGGASGGIGQFKSLNADDDMAYTALVVNKSVPGLTLTAQYLTLDGEGAAKTNGFQDIYAEVAYAGKAGSFNYGVAANYLNTNWEQANIESGDMYGAKVSFGMGDLKTYVAYTAIGENGGAGVKNGFGHGAHPEFAKGVSRTVSYTNDDSQAYSLDVNYNFKAIGLLAGARYTIVEDDNAATDRDKFDIQDLYLTYKVAQLKGLQFDANYQGYGKDADGRDIWFKATYKF
ncbi:MAG: OprD family outer membrane porin [Sulfurospirillaceae bacterium]|nr:OprD family outer membrane porin [Sulfurospirillaceae bacterium]